MSLKAIWSIVTVLMVAILLLASCSPKATTAPIPGPTPTQAPTPTTPSPVIPAPVASAPDVANMINVTLTKLDGTRINKQVEKPKYGGTLSLLIVDPVWDLKLMTTGTQGRVLASEKLLFGDWSRGTAGTSEISWQLYEYLSMDHFMGLLAQAWEMPDEETIIYHLRRGVHWALDNREASILVGGRELTADDIVFSLKFQFFTDTKTNLGRTVGGEKKADIRATDKYTVVIKAPKQDLNQFLGFVSDGLLIFPPEVIQKYGNFTSWDKVVGTGAFMMKDYVSGSVTTWVKNPNYWGYDPVLGKDYPLPYVDAVKAFNIPDQSTLEASFRTGRLDGTLTLTKEQWKSMVKTYPIAKTKIVDFGTSSNRIAMQMNDKSAPWQDIRVRQALMLAINHQEIVDTYYGGAADLQAFPLPNAPELYALGWAIPLKELPQETQELFGYNPDKAKKLLAEAGYPNGFKTSLIINATSAEWNDLGAMIKGYWAKVGVDLTLDVKDPGVFAAYTNSANYPAMMHESRWGTATLYHTFDPGGSYNSGNVVDPRIQELRLKMFDVMWDLKKRAPIMRELYQYTMSQVWYLPLPSKWNYKVYQPWLKNYDAEASLGYFGQPWPFVWLDMDLKKKLGY